jgi:two-component system sensor histidine kinase HydH
VTTTHREASFTEADPDGLCVAVFESITAAILVCDEAHEVVRANARATELLGREVTDLVGCHVEEVLGRDVVEASPTREPRSPTLRHKIDVNVPGGGRARLGCAVSGPIETGRGPCYAILFQDITGWEKLRIENERLLRLAAVGDVLPAILHELKNPLAALAMSLEATLEELEDGSLRDDLHAILGEARKLRLTLDGVGSVGRKLDTDRYHAIDHACSDAFKVLSATANAKGVKTVAEVGSLPLLPFDPAVMRGIVFNLVNNAIAACDRGDEISLRVGFSAGQASLQVVVRDTGAGMSPETRARCLDMFFTTKRNGSGIGLAVVNQAVREAGGTLDVRSALGVGTAISLVLPLPDPRKPQNGSSDKSSQEEDEQCLV